MPQTVSLPEWVQWFAALAPACAALVTAMVAGVVALVSYMQLRVARQKLLLDLFEQRFEVQQTLADLCSQVQAQPGDLDFRLTARVLGRVAFLFPQDAALQVTAVVDLAILLNKSGELGEQARIIARLNPALQQATKLMLPMMDMRHAGKLRRWF